MIELIFNTSDSSPAAVTSGKDTELEFVGLTIVCDPLFEIWLLLVPVNKTVLIFELLSTSETVTASDSLL
jgi:hypothetical protein